MTSIHELHRLLHIPKDYSIGRERPAPRILRDERAKALDILEKRGSISDTGMDGLMHGMCRILDRLSDMDEARPIDLRAAKAARKPHGRKTVLRIDIARAAILAAQHKSSAAISVETGISKTTVEKARQKLRKERKLT